MAFASTGYAADNKQQIKMAECNKEGGDKKSDQGKAFMKSCLNAKMETPQQLAPRGDSA